MGSDIKLLEGYVNAKTKGLKGALIPLAYPSVGATENLMMAAVLANGTTIIQNAAREPEIVDLGHMLQKMGASIRGLETSEITIEGVKSLSGVRHTIIPDRIEAGTFLIASAITKGDIVVKKMDPSHLKEVIEALKKAGMGVNPAGDGILRIKWDKPVKPVNVETDVYPGFPTDMQAQWLALMSITAGKSRIRETVFENRFLHVQELMRFGADISLSGRDAVTKGVDHLSGCSCMVSDLRAGAALVLAGLAAKGKTTVLRIYHLDRGYEKLDKKLRALGAKIKRVRKK
jgi:UDP-N-acetylglucosamine 1-carboxyvinyltransferase